jgi:death on curing protein
LECLTLTVQDVITIHDTIIQTRGGSYGILKKGLLYSCVERPTFNFYGFELFDTMFLKAAAMMEAINEWHIFADGNKRTALAAGALFLDRNGWIFRPDSRTDSIMRQVARAQHVFSSFGSWVESCCTPK